MPTGETSSGKFISVSERVYTDTTKTNILYVDELIQSYQQDPNFLA